MDRFMLLTLMEGTIIFHSKKCYVMMDQLRASYTWLAFDTTEDFVDGEPQWGEVLFHPEGSKWIRRENRESMLLEGGLPLILVSGMGWNLSLRVRLLSVVVTLEGVVDETIHSFLQLKLRLDSRQDFTHPSDVILQEILNSV